MGSVTTACASAGIIAGILALTGLNIRLTGILVDLSRGNLFVLALMTAIAAYILGMGMPTVAVYITTSITLAPALIQLGLSPIVAHFFVFYTAMLAFITPPIALAVYAAAGIAKEDIFKVGFEAIKLGLLLFVLPFLFIFKPAILLQGSIGDIIFVFANTFISLFPLSIGLIGYSFKEIGLIKRIIYFTVALLILYPEVMSTIVGIALFISLIVLDKVRVH
jgi:TRAP-type uncharacterized transport system fused permease subunit